MKFNCPRCGALSSDFKNASEPSVEFVCNVCSRQVTVPYKPKVTKQKYKKRKHKKLNTDIEPLSADMLVHTSITTKELSASTMHPILVVIDNPIKEELENE